MYIVHTQKGFLVGEILLFSVHAFSFPKQSFRKHLFAINWFGHYSFFNYPFFDLCVSLFYLFRFSLSIFFLRFAWNLLSKVTTNQGTPVTTLFLYCCIVFRSYDAKRNECFEHNVVHIKPLYWDGMQMDVLGNW